MVDFIRYLAAKKTVDDRALNRAVWERLRAALVDLALTRPVRILEVGCGIGTMVERLLDWGLAEQVQYVGGDSQAENIQVAYERIWDWARAKGYQCGHSNGEMVLEKRNIIWQVRFQQADATDYRASPAAFDVIIAQAFLDLVDVPTILSNFIHWLAPAGLCYFTINFDGGTIFEPVAEKEREEKIMRLYHQSMDTRLVDGHLAGDSQTGRHLFEQMREAGMEVLAAGSSDWVVYPGQEGYPADEAYFLHCILNFFEESLTGNPELAANVLRTWLAERREQIERRDLIYIAHQLDLLGQLPLGLKK